MAGHGKYPAGIRSAGNRLYMRLRRPGRGWGWEATGLTIEQVDAAVKLRKTTQSVIDSGEKPEDYGRTKVSSYARRWIDDRKARGLRSVADDEQRVRDHILKHEFETGRTFGDLWVTDVRPSHCRAVVRGLSSKGLAPRTILNVNSLGKQLFSDAVSDELISSSPWAVPRKEIPRKRDKNPEWREGALFAPAEIRRLLTATFDVIPWDRQIFWALLYFGALRFGEAAGLRWADLLPTEPLPSLHIHRSFSTRRRSVGETKTAGSRKMPVHPALAVALAEWRKNGWAAFFGRHPDAEDLIAPSRRGVHRSKNHMLHHLHEDLDKLGLRRRRQHDLRRSFISHAVDAGATKDRLKPATHGLGTAVMDLYDTPAWKACCAEVLKLPFGDDLCASHVLAPVECADLTEEAILLVEAPGIEFGTHTTTDHIQNATNTVKLPPTSFAENDRPLTETTFDCTSNTRLVLSGHKLGPPSPTGWQEVKKKPEKLENTVKAEETDEFEDLCEELKGLFDG